MSHIRNNRFNIHCDDRFIFDNHYRTGYIVGHFAACNLNQFTGFFLVDADDLTNLFKGEPFDRM